MRQWELDTSKSTRKGFAFVPDYGCTGFMVQGSTLDALIAECGDILSTTGLTEMLTTSVILPRVRTADTLLLLFVFHHNYSAWVTHLYLQVF